MNSKPSSSKTTVSTETKRNDSVISKLRRLKIEENLLLQSVKKIEQKINYEGYESDFTKEADCRNGIKISKDSFSKIKNLFDDLKTVTNSQEILAELEIDEIKNKVQELETAMRSFKLCLSGELSSLKRDEMELTKQLEDLHFKEVNLKKKLKMSSVSKQTVLSPVRLLMTSPLKCPEVQEFQDFMTNSPNRYGGWNEYYHNIFVKLWQKHVGHSADNSNTNIVENLAFDNFSEECLSKIQGIDAKNLMLHIEWYKKYLKLKSKQQIAIDKWKSNRKPIRNKFNEDNLLACSAQDMGESARQSKNCVQVKKKLDVPKTTHKVLSEDDIKRFMIPTKQWLNRCDDELKVEQINCLENLEKLRIPHWRQHIL